MKNIKLNTIKYLYIISFILSMLIRNTVIQNVILILSLFFLNYIIVIKCNIKDKVLIVSALIIILINISLVYISYFQVLNLGFNDGLARDYIFNINYWDHYNYYYESEILKDYWVNGSFIDWLHGMAPTKMFYGYYNVFVIYNTLIKMLIGNNLNSLILLKLQFVVGSIYLVYLISIKYIKSEFAIIPVVLMNLFPAYLQSNISLIRDSLILFFVLAVFYEIVYKEKNIIKICALSIGLIALRSYVAIVIMVLAFTYRYLFLRKIKIKNILLYFLGGVVCVFSVGMFLQMQGWGFLGLDVLKNMSESGGVGQWNEDVILSPTNIIFYNIKYLFLGVKISSAKYFSPFIYDWLLGLSYIFIPVFCLPMLFCFLSSNRQIKQFYSIILIIAFLIQGLILYIYGGNVPRLYFPWIWGQFILFAYIVQRIFERFDKKIILIISAFYCFFIAFILKFYISY